MGCFLESLYKYKPEIIFSFPPLDSVPAKCGPCFHWIVFKIGQKLIHDYIKVLEREI